MGRRTDIDPEDDEQQSNSSVSTTTTRLVHESQMQSNDEKFVHDDDPLIHDTILPHRKRVRRDTLLSIQQVQRSVQAPPSSESSSSLSIDCKLEHVSFTFFFLLSRPIRIQISQSRRCVNDILLSKLSKQHTHEIDLERAPVRRKRTRERERANE